MYKLLALLAISQLVACAAEDQGHKAFGSSGKADSVTSALCQRLADGTASVTELGKGEVLNEGNWDQFDVLTAFDYGACYDYVDQAQLEVDGHVVWRFGTTHDACDGGNTYGVVYSEDLTVPIAHIYDGDIYCEGDWSKEYQTSYAGCEPGAEEYAKDKMAAFGMTLTSTTSFVEGGATYASIRVRGKLPDYGNRSVTVSVKTNLDTCEYTGATITDLPLD